MTIIEQIKAKIERRSKKPMNQDGLEEEIKRYYDDMDGDCRYAQTARHFAQWGAEHAREQMLKDAIDTTVHLEPGANPVIEIGVSKFGLKVKDKVRVIIVKED